MSSTLMPTNLDQMPIIFTRGKGAWLWDTKNKSYLDALSGLGVCALGHGHPLITKTIADQAATLIHISNTYNNEPQNQLAEKLTKLSKMEKAVFVNSGAEAVETALKLIRLYAHKKNISEPTVITIDQAFHGHPLGASSASNLKRVRNGFEPLLPQFIHAPFNEIEALEKIIATNPNIVAIQLEPIQGDGGIRSTSEGYLQQVRKCCDEHHLLLFFDEVQCGFGRSGKWFAFQYENIIPDLLTIAKPLANGLPIGACLASNKASKLFQPGQHGSTFGGNPLACRVALTVIEIIENQNLLQNILERGQQIQNELKAKLAENPRIKEIRGKGLMLGIELDKPYSEMMQIGLEQGLLFNIVQEKVIRLLPPYIISQEEAQQIVERLIRCIQNFK